MSEILTRLKLIDSFRMQKNANGFYRFIDYPQRFLRKNMRDISWLLYPFFNRSCWHIKVEFSIGKHKENLE